MTLYMTQFAYTSVDWTALTQSPEDRSGPFGRLVQSMGGRLLTFYNSFGEYDGLVIYEAPDEITAAAIVLHVTSSGHLSRLKTTVLLSAEDGVEAMQRAGEATYPSPEQPHQE